MLPELDYTESDELGYYTTFGELFPDFAPFHQDPKKYIEINFSYTDEDTPPNEAQLNAHKLLLTQSNQMLENLVQYLKQDEEYFMEFYGVYRETKHERTYLDGEKYTYTYRDGFPAVKNEYDLINHFTVNAINISDSEEDGISYIGFSGGCPWDEEHGFGAAFHKATLLHVGDWDYGRSPSWGKSNAEDDLSLTKSFTNFHLLEPLKERKTRLSNLSKSIQIENTEGYEEIFDWLVLHQMIYGYRNTSPDLTAKEKIVVLNEIQELTFFGNQILKVPQSINLLENLTSLSFSFNNLEVIPLELTTLTRLKKLSIIGSKIKHIPKEMFLLKNLESLCLSDNKLLSIPEEIGQLSNLKHLDLGSNMLSDLPSSFSSCANLESLILNYNAFANFPDIILGVKSLKDLDLSSNQLVNIPQSISQLNLLEELDLRFNQLTTLPESLFSQMLNLQRLQVVVNHISLEDLKRFQRLISTKITNDFESAIDCVIDDLKRREES